jgi:tetratricopeptide (TPR) repeat protein
MRPPISCLLLLVLLASALSCLAQSLSGTVRTVLVLPFENRSKAPGLEWIGESFPEILSQRLASDWIFPISREDRVRAFDRMGIPVNSRPSHATLYRIAEQMDCDYVVMGEYDVDGLKFTARAKVLGMKRLRQTSPVESSGPLVNLIDIQTDLAWQLLKTVRPETTISREDLQRSFPAIRLDAFENYIRGILATSRQEKVKRLREAIRLNPQYTLAELALGKSYFADKEYDSAAYWLSRIPQNARKAGEAYFLLGLSYYHQNQFDRAENAFTVSVAKLPLTEVYNNLGAAALRRGKRSALQLLQRTIEVDPNDPDYHFNFALALYKSGDSAAAVKNLRESLARYPTDSEARQFLDEISESPSAGTEGSGGAPGVSSPPWLPQPRLKPNYDETSFRMLAISIQNAARKAPAAPADQPIAFHLRHGMELLEHGLTVDAEKEFAQVLAADPLNAAAHFGMARVAESRGDMAKAQQEASSSIGLGPTAAAYLVLARAGLKQNQLILASYNVDMALSLEPANIDAISLKQEIASRQAQASEAKPN